MPDPTDEDEDKAKDDNSTKDASKTEAKPKDEAKTSEDEPKQRGKLGRFKDWFVARWSKAEENWRFLGKEMRRHRLYTKVIFVHLRYTFGYLAFGFLVSAPLQIGQEGGGPQEILKSLILGLVFAVPCLLLYPFTIIDWSEMRIPEFKNLELALTRWAAYLAGGFLVVTVLARLFLSEELPEQPESWEPEFYWALDPSVASINLGLMIFAWLRVKFHTVLFKEFYTITSDDDLVLLKHTMKSDQDEGENGGDGKDDEDDEDAEEKDPAKLLQKLADEAKAEIEKAKDEDD